MKLAEKLKNLRLQEGKARGLMRALTQSEVSRMIKVETGRGLTQAYLSQLESGKRRHLTAETREQLAKFFRVHPGYLVDDPPAARRSKASKTPLDKWLIDGAEELRRVEPAVAALLRDIAGERNPRRYFDLLVAVRRHREGLEKVFRDYGVPR
jgi:transcriptional regulator with XRE-family HTH domain